MSNKSGDVNLLEENIKNLETEEQTKRTRHFSKNLKNFFNFEGFLWELIGTFYFFLSIFESNKLSFEIGLPIVFVQLTALIHLGGGISDAHYNPIVTFILTVRGRCGIITGILYGLIHITSSFLAGLVQIILLPQNGTIELASFGVQHTYTTTQACVAEFFYSTLLCLAVLFITSKKFTNNPLNGVIIGLSFFAAVGGSAPVSGGALNPALPLGPNIIKYFYTFSTQGYWNDKLLEPLWIYVMFPYLGAITALLLFFLLHPDELKGSFDNFRRANKKLFLLRTLFGNANTQQIDDEQHIELKDPKEK